MRLKVSDLPKELVLVQDTGPTGDECHFLMQGLSKSFYRNFVKTHTDLSEFEICGAVGPRALTLADIEAQQPRTCSDAEE